MKARHFCNFERTILNQWMQINEMYNLNNKCQKHREDLVTFVKHCQDLTLDCYDQEEQEALVEICINNIVPNYMIYLENICSAQFSRLLEAVGKTSISVKRSTWRNWKTNKKEAHHALAMDDRSDHNPQKRKERDGDRKTYIPLACSDTELQATLDTIFAGEAIKPPRPCKVFSRGDKKDPRYCHYHQCVEHLSITCQTLRKILHVKIHERTLERPRETQAIDISHLPKC